MSVGYLPDLLADVAAPRVLELGSRHVSTARWTPPAHWQVVGVDLHPGPGVDVVADAHELSAHFPAASFDAVYSHAVFEHLLLPWKVALQIARVLRPGGVAWIVTHEAFPLHERPWDFWRFGSACWEALFPPALGLSLVGSRPLHPCTVRPRAPELPSFAGHAGCEVQVRKVAEPDPALAWDVALPELLPAGHRYAAPRGPAARALSAASRRLALLAPARPSPADPFGLSHGTGRWLLLAGPDARPVDLPGAEVVHVGAGAHGLCTAALRGLLAAREDGSVADLALLDLLHRDARPWSLVLELARVLAPGGRLWIDTVATAPADVGGFRLSAEALLGLLHPVAGFRLEQRSQLDPASIVPGDGSGAFPAPAFLRTTGLARKVGEPDRARLLWE